MMDSIFRGRQIVLLTAMAGSVAFVGGCDRAMLVHVNAQVLDAQGYPLRGRTVDVVADCHARWPRPQTGVDEASVFDPSKRVDAYTTDANGFIRFNAINFEPVSLLDGIVDVILPPSIKFLITIPGRPLSAYAVTFIPGGDYGQGRFSYRHFDLKTGRTLRPTYSDASGGLDINIRKPPRDASDPQSAWPPSLDIRVLTREGASRDSAASSGVSSGN